MKKGSKKLTAMAAIELADYWIKQANDFDDAVRLVRTYVRGYSRQNMIIEGIRHRAKLHETDEISKAAAE